LQRFHDLVPRPSVEIPGRLVCQQHAWRIDEGAGDGDTLLLTSRELAGAIALAIGKAKQPERGAGSLETDAPARRPGGR
jgi:hypothetical protein